MRRSARRTAAGLALMLCCVVPLRARTQQDLEAAARPLPVFLWLRDARDAPPPAPWLELLGGAALEARTPAPWLLEAPFVDALERYLGHAPGRAALHPERTEWDYAGGRRAYLDSRSEAAWPRAFDPFDPAARAALRAELGRSAERFPGPFRAVSLGDEVGLSPFGDPVSFGPSEHERRRWAVWLTEGQGARFGLAPGATLIGTERALRAGTDRAFAQFLARRRFEREAFSDLLLELADEARRLWPGTPVALLGNAGETAFGGLDFHRLGTGIDVFEPYAVGHAQELLETLRALPPVPGAPGERLRLWTTVFAEQAEPWQLEALVDVAAERGRDALVLWSDRALGGRPDRLAALRAALERARTRARTRTSGSADPHGVALLLDFDSLCRGWFLDAAGDGASWPRRLGGYQAEHGTLERAQARWLRRAGARDRRPGALPEGLWADPGDPRASERFREWVAIELRVLDDVELQCLRAHLARGGRLAVHGGFATLRPDGTRREGDAYAELAREWPGAVRALAAH